MLNGYVLSMALFRLTRVAQVVARPMACRAAQLDVEYFWKLRRIWKVTARRVEMEAGTLESKTRLRVVWLELCNRPA